MSQVLVRAEQVAGTPHQHRPPPDLHVLLLEDLLVLLQKQDEAAAQVPQQDGRGLLRLKADLQPRAQAQRCARQSSVATGTHKNGPSAQAPGHEPWYSRPVSAG